MKLSELRKALVAAEKAAQAAGTLMRRNHLSSKIVNEVKQHDIKLELDVRCQKLIERTLQKAVPTASILGEEGTAGDPQSNLRWVIDPIDGTVNFFYGIPHACVSIALQEKVPAAKLTDSIPPGTHLYEDGYKSILGVVYDPFMDEIWTAMENQPARLNGRIIHASQRTKLAEAVLALGFSKSQKILKETMVDFGQLLHRVRKIRILGAAALSLTYVATGRMDIYMEKAVRLWDIAAGGLIIERAGGKFESKRIKGDHFYEMIGSNGPLHKKFQNARNG